MNAAFRNPAVLDIMSLFDAMDEDEQATIRQHINPVLKTWDDIDIELYECEVLTELVWDLATKIGYDGPSRHETLDRLAVLSSITKGRLREFREAARFTELRRPASKKGGGA